MTGRPHGAMAGLLLVALAAVPARAESTAPRVVQYSNDALTVRLTNAPVNEVLGEIGHQAGAEIWGEVAGAPEVTADFDAVPLADALYRLLGNQNFALVYGEKGNLKAVKLLGEARSTVTVVRAAPTTTTFPQVKGELRRAVRLLDRTVSLPAGSSLVRLFGAPTTTLRRLLETGLGSDDATVRADTVRAALQAIEADPELSMAIAIAVGNSDDTTLTLFLRRVAKEHTKEIAKLVNDQTTIDPLRLRASTIFQSLAQSPGM
jgi:hypothetical protein